MQCSIIFCRIAEISCLPFFVFNVNPCLYIIRQFGTGCGLLYNDVLSELALW